MEVGYRMIAQKIIIWSIANIIIEKEFVYSFEINSSLKFTENNFAFIKLMSMLLLLEYLKLVILNIQYRYNYK